MKDLPAAETPTPEDLVAAIKEHESFAGSKWTELTTRKKNYLELCDAIMGFRAAKEK
jgi:hypothetical protein